MTDIKSRDITDLSPPGRSAGPVVGISQPAVGPHPSLGDCYCLVVAELVSGSLSPGDLTRYSLTLY